MKTEIIPHLLFKSILKVCFDVGWSDEVELNFGLQKDKSAASVVFSWYGEVLTHCLALVYPLSRVQTPPVVQLLHWLYQFCHFCQLCQLASTTTRPTQIIPYYSEMTTCPHSLVQFYQKIKALSSQELSVENNHSHIDRQNKPSFHIIWRNLLLQTLSRLPGCNCPGLMALSVCIWA